MLLLCLLAEYFKLNSYNSISWPLMVAHLIMFFKMTLPHLNRRIQKLSPALKAMLPLSSVIQEQMASKLIFTVLVLFCLCFWLGKRLLTGTYSLFSSVPKLQSGFLTKESFPLQFKKAKRAVSSRLGSSSSWWSWFTGKNNWSKNKGLYAT